MRYLVLILLLILAVLLVLFGVQNPQPVTVSFLSLQAANLSLSLVVVISAIVGAALVALLSAWGAIQRGLRSRREIKQRADLEARVATLERENAALKKQVAATPPVAAASGSPPKP